MPLEDFLNVVEQFTLGLPPIRCRPYPDEQTVRVAVVWSRDGRPWRMAHDQTADEIRQIDGRNRRDGFLPFEVAGYLAAVGDARKPTSKFAALWAQRTRSEDDAKMVIASSAAELTKVLKQLNNTSLVPLTWHAWLQADDKLSYSGVWHRSATGSSQTGYWWWYDVSEAELTSRIAQQSSTQIDLDLTAAAPPTGTKERGASALEAAEATLKEKPDDLKARLAQASAQLVLGENQKAIDDLDSVIKKSPQEIQAYQLRAIAHARLGHKDQARADREKFEIGNGNESQKLYLAVIVAANWVRELTRRWTGWKPPSRTSQRIPLCTTILPVPTPWHLGRSPERTRQGVSRCQSEPSACSARRSRTATPITGTCRRTPTSTLCGRYLRLPTL